MHFFLFIVYPFSISIYVSLCFFSVCLLFSLSLSISIYQPIYLPPFFFLSVNLYIFLSPVSLLFYLPHFSSVCDQNNVHIIPSNVWTIHKQPVRKFSVAPLTFPHPPALINEHVRKLSSVFSLFVQRRLNKSNKNI